MKKITIALCILFSGFAFAQDGILDTSFGTNGSVTVNTDNGASFGNYIQPDGKIIYIEANKFHRLNADGTPDTTFGASGAVNITQPIYYIEGYTVYNNQITVITKGLYDVYTMGRYNFDGTVDATLGGGTGYLTLDLGDDMQGHVIVSLSADNKLLIGANSDTAYGSYDNYYVKKFNADGSEDSTFNYYAGSGINISSTSIGYATIEYATGLKSNSGGSIVISGLSGFRDTTNSGHTQATFAMISNSNTYAQPLARAQNYEIYGAAKSDLAFDQNDNIYVLGGQTYIGSVATPVNVIQKWTASGGTANSFGTAGVLTLAPLNIAANTKADFRKILIQPDGKILLAGVAAKTNALVDYTALIVARYLVDGTIDATFGTDGYVLYDIPHPNTAANRNELTQFYASADYASIYVAGSNLQNAVVLKYSNISMTPLTIPAFTQVAPICSGDALASLPTTSDNGVTGTWAPAIDNTATTTYTFTPAATEHAATAAMTITVNQPTSSSITQSACENYTWAANGIVYTESGAYTNITTNAAGCTHTTTLNLTINQPTTATVNATACDNYTWSANGTTYTDSGAYVLVTTNGAGCQHTTTLNLTINHASTITGASSQGFFGGATLANVTVNPSNVVWYASLTNALSLQDPIAASTALTDGAVYYAVNFSAQGCPSDPFAVTVSVNLAAGTFDNAGFSLYPNPATGMISIDYSQEIQTVSIYNFLGQQMIVQPFNSKSAKLDVSHLAAGSYFVKINSGGLAKTVKIIKQ